MFLTFAFASPSSAGRLSTHKMMAGLLHGVVEQRARPPAVPPHFSAQGLPSCVYIIVLNSSSFYRRTESILKLAYFDPCVEKPRFTE